MLRRLKIGGRVNLLVAVPLLALVGFAAVGAVAIQRASVRGEEYRALQQAEALRSDTSPSGTDLTVAWSEVTEIAALVLAPGTLDDATAAVIDTHFQRLDRLERDWEAAMDHWSEQDLPADIHQSFVVDGGAAGDQFFSYVRDTLAPAVADRDREAVVAALDTLRALRQEQQAAADTARAWAEGETVRREQRTDDFVGWVLVFVGTGGAVLVLLTLWLSVRVRRSIVRPLRRFARHASELAEQQLPDAVEALQSLPPGSAPPRLEPFRVDSTRDELADLARSFTQVQDVAVDLAAQQSAMRQVVTDNLVNIARRNQDLLDRALGLVNGLEDREADPANLDTLFRIDHLATRMRRNAQSLLVLAGVEQEAPDTHPRPVGDVVRAALSEVEHYGQVDIGDLGEVAIRGDAAAGVTHLLAELLENATMFSPPGSSIAVAGRAVPDGHQLAIFDHGQGMTQDEMDEANRKLNDVSPFDRGVSRMLGFQVVGRIAARLGIRVMLTTTPGGSGVTVVVRLPDELLADVPTPSVPTAGLRAATGHLTEPLPIVAPMEIRPVTLTPASPGNDPQD